MSFIIISLSMLALLGLLGMAVMFSYFSGQAAGAMAGLVMGVDGDGGRESAPELSPQAKADLAEAARIEALLRDLDRRAK